MGINKNTNLNLIIPSHCNYNLIIVIIFKLIVMTIENPFHFACRQWYSYNNPGILT